MMKDERLIIKESPESYLKTEHDPCTFFSCFQLNLSAINKM